MLVSIIVHQVAAWKSTRRNALSDAGFVLADTGPGERRRRQRPALIFVGIPRRLGGGYWEFDGVSRATATRSQSNDNKVIDRNKFIAMVVADDIQEKLENYIKVVEEMAEQPALPRRTRRDSQWRREAAARSRPAAESDCSQRLSKGEMTGDTLEVT